ncbi:hypothetical protein AWE51_22060 [Aquimarina aggregata]|uniref:Uncharacterized protein n=1 Tax=Aquimarina aggregata TaxID=1642818 RepID=A0A163BH29_9FLAO|nr:hypothetical protein [Aquimarina aggregata]KZS41391.1 hypothetical protein AWE51_22060 [Aquimarina aggregata]
MNTNFIAIIALFMTTNHSIQGLIGTHINEVSNAILIQDESFTSTKLYKINEEKVFLGKSYNSTFITTNKEDLVEEIAISLMEIIDKSFYERMVEVYGVPSLMLGPDKSTVDMIRDRTNATESAQFTGNLEDYKFEDKPLYILWEKDHYSIKVVLGMETDTFHSTQIKFSNKNFLTFKK